MKKISKLTVIALVVNLVLYILLYFVITIESSIVEKITVAIIASGWCAMTSVMLVLKDKQYKTDYEREAKHLEWLREEKQKRHGKGFQLPPNPMEDVTPTATLHLENPTLVYKDIPIVEYLEKILATQDMNALRELIDDLRERG